MRVLVILAVVIVGLAALSMRPNRVDPDNGGTSPQLSYVTTAHQLGVVGYRDPAGAIAPDGKHFAYSEGRFIRVIPIAGGAPLTLAPGDGQIRYLTWRANDTVMAQDSSDGAWWLYDIATTKRRDLWCHTCMMGSRDLTWNSEGSKIAGLTDNQDTGRRLWIFPATGSNPQHLQLTGRASFPAFMPDGAIACVIDKRLSVPCGQPAAKLNPDIDVIGPIAVTMTTAYFASPNQAGMVELWSADLPSRRAHRVVAFARDAYAPSIASDGTVVFKVQSYRTNVADVDANGGAIRQLATFQSETPSYHPTTPLLSFTYGTWRRVLDDGKYPDIAQEIGTIDLSQNLPASKPLNVIAQSESEDQAMAWSPNGKWIAFHSHREMSDDVWLRPADGSQPDKRITFLGRGAEVGWPRWSPDGTQVLLDGANRASGRSVIYRIGVDQDTGAITSDIRMRRAEGIYDADITHAEWLGNDAVVALLKEAPAPSVACESCAGRHAIVTMNLTGGAPTVIYRFATEHDFSGLAVSRDGKYLAFAAPASDGFHQVFKIATEGGTPVQLTNDHSNKTQPAFSPDGSRVAFTVWSYDATFWSFKGR
jgi:Tol biopolymer transport system component